MEVKTLAREEKKGKMTVEEAGRKGGLKTAETHGQDFYSEIGRKGWHNLMPFIPSLRPPMEKNQ